MAGLLDDPDAPPQTASLTPDARPPSPDDMGSEAGGLPGLLAPPPASAGPTGRPEYFPFDPKSETGTAYFQRMAPHAAALALPPGYRVEMMPQGGFRPQSTVKGGGESMHASAGAFDANIYDQDGKLIPNEPGVADTTGHYGNLAVAFRQLADPKMQNWLGWGGFYSAPYGPPGTVDQGAYGDIQHYDWGGDRGMRGAQPQPLRQMSEGRSRPAPAPTVANVTGRPP